ncbi:MAG: glycoside hydrolase family 2 protein, partial [Bacteroidales bacterium]
MKNLLALIALFLSIQFTFSQESQIIYLSGTGIDDAVDWEFYCTEGRNSGSWTTIPVPSNWELHGFGEYNYGHDKDKADEEGLYRHTFDVPRAWKSKQVKIVFVASMTDTEVKINGELAGPVHQGAFYQFEYDISDLLKFGKENLLEVKVSKMSSNESVNMAERKADYWIFGGIFRPVYLKVSPAENIDRIAVDAKADGNLYVEVFTEGIKKSDRISAQLVDMEGEKIGETFSVSLDKGDEKKILQTKFEDIKTWSPEFPDLYILRLQLEKDGEILHLHKERIGFRTVEIRQRDGIYVNGKKIMFRGVNRHSFWPESGRALSKRLSIQDVELMKGMNLNAVRMSHYPPDPHFLDVCDSLGLFVLNELAGWQRPPYDTEVGKKLVKELVIRDVNHPSIVLWDNGNEGGWNNDLNDEFAKYDPQKRAVIHPWELFRGLDSKHYRDWNYGAGTFFNGRDIFFPTEFLHGLYDGGHGAGLEDWWNLMLDRPLAAGGFLWVFADEGVVRTDMDGWIDTKKSQAPDGIVGPYREKEGSYFTIKEIWSPVHINMEFLPPAFNGKIEVENRFFFTNINQCSFESKLYAWNGDDLVANSIPDVLVPSIETRNKGEIEITLPGNWKSDNDVLELIAFDPHGNEIMTWSWPVKTPAELSGK